VAKELQIGGGRYWIVSDPQGGGWKASVLQVHDGGQTDDIGIEAFGETRTAADAAAERKLRRLLGPDAR
jgi:hypothetical protein